MLKKGGKVIPLSFPFSLAKEMNEMSGKIRCRPSLELTLLPGVASKKHGLCARGVISCLIRGLGFLFSFLSSICSENVPSVRSRQTIILTALGVMCFVW